jgi:carbon-monoxide dehydrogenase medium subunit
MLPFKLFLPESFEEAIQLMKEHSAKPISGGTAVTTLIKERIFQPTAIVNLRKLERDHSYIREMDGEIQIGALTTLRTIETSEIVKRDLPVVADCISKIASIRIRNVATIGGNLAHADPDLDLPPVLAGLDAHIDIIGEEGERSKNIKEFIQGYYETDLKEGELIKSIRIPVSSDRKGIYLKHRALSEADWPCVGVAAFMDNSPGSIPEVFINSVADTPIMRIEGIEEIFSDGITSELIDKVGELASEQCDPIGDSRGSVWYKRKMAGEFTIRALREVTGVGESLI